MATQIFGAFKKARKNSAKVAEFKKLGLTLVGHLTTTIIRKKCVYFVTDELLDTCPTSVLLARGEDCRFNFDLNKWMVVVFDGSDFHKWVLSALKEAAREARQQGREIRRQAEQAHALRRLAQGEWLSTSYLRYIFGELANKWIAYRNKFCAYLKRGVAKFVNRFEQLFGIFSSTNAIGDFVK